jgi:hypothetical protein
MSIEHIRALKEAAKEPKEKKIYSIPKMSAKKQLQIEEDKKLFEQDKIFYKEIWDNSEHKCQCGCNANLGDEPLTTFFHHLLEKAKYPQFRHEYINIMILLPACHNAYHSMSSNRPEVIRRRSEAEKFLLN